MGCARGSSQGRAAARVARLVRTVATLCCLSVLFALAGGAGGARAAEPEPLPEPDRTGSRPLEGLLDTRLSVREFADESLDRAVLGQLLWATGGTTFAGRVMHRTTPSAGALYPLELYLVTKNGLARYDPDAHALITLKQTDLRAGLSAAALGQDWVGQAPAIIVIAAEPQRTEVKYGGRGDRYVLIEAGCACQNLLLQATALGLGSVPVGAFDDNRVARVLGLPASQRALLIVPVGAPRDNR
jgi:SagB-type dehydrogenase family enzyme